MWKWFKCTIGFHGDHTNIGAGRGSMMIYGKSFPVVYRLWKCDLCGDEFGVAECPSLHGFGEKKVSPDFVRGSSGYREFEKEG